MDWKTWANKIIKLPRLTKFIANRLAECIDNLNNSGYKISEKLHVVSFSIGGPVSGMLGAYLKQKPRRITGNYKHLKY